MPLSISKLVRDRIQAMLADPVYGFNAQLAAIAPPYGVVAFQIDWPAHTNWAFGRISPDILEAVDAVPEISDTSSALSYVFLTIDTSAETDRRITMESTFAGDVQAIIELTLSWEQSQTLPDFASWADACQAAIREALNSAAVQSAGMPLLNPKWYATKGPILLGGANFRQSIQALPVFTVIAN